MADLDAVVWSTAFSRADHTEHTSTVDPVEFYGKMTQCLRIPLVGLVAEQKLKLLGVALKKRFEIETAVYWPAFN